MKTALTAYKSCIFICFILLIANASLAQTKRFEGYYINLSGDTIYGTFDNYRQWSNNPSKVIFQPSGSASIELTPVNSRSFHIAGYDTYLSFAGMRMTNPITFMEAVEGDLEERFDTLITFLREIAFTEKYRFYIFRDKLRWNFYYSEEGQQPQELIQNVYLKENFYGESLEFKTQLSKLFNLNINSFSLQKLEYTEDYITEFILQHANGSKPGMKRKNPENAFAAYFGSSFNSYSVEGYSGSLSPVAGVAYYFYSSRNFGRLFFMPQLLGYSYQSSITLPSSSGGTITYTYKAAPVINFGIHVGYNFINGTKVKAYVAPGLSSAYLHNNIRRVEFKSSSPGEPYSDKIKSLSYSAKVNSGVILHKKYLIWANYVFKMPIGYHMNRTGYLSSFQVGAGYKFSK